MAKNVIRVSEMFYSLQGEGSTMGAPSVFLRLQSCNLLCKGSWICDTIEVWKRGEPWDTEKLAKWLINKYKDEFLNGTHFIITGGEPLLQQKELPMLVKFMETYLRKLIWVEVETNGTVTPEDFHYVNQFNVSPKTSNSGMPKNKRINPLAIRLLNSFVQPISTFKFVVTDEQDLKEIIHDFQVPFAIPSRKIWLMPGCGTREQFESVAPMVAKACKDHGFHFSSRLQINLWNEVTGV